MRVIVCGSRGWTNRELVADELANLPGCATIVHGAARGADRIAGQEAQKLGLLVEEHPADWNTHGKRAGWLRNEQMAMLGADLCIAFWDGSSRGTSHMMEMAAKHRIPVRCVNINFPNRVVVR